MFLSKVSGESTASLDNYSVPSSSSNISTSSSDQPSASLLSKFSLTAEVALCALIILSCNLLVCNLILPNRINNAYNKGYDKGRSDAKGQSDVKTNQYDSSLLPDDGERDERNELSSLLTRNTA